jgi:hypothetical protein
MTRSGLFYVFLVNAQAADDEGIALATVTRRDDARCYARSLRSMLGAQVLSQPAGAHRDAGGGR